MHENKQESRKVVSLVKMAENLPSVSNPQKSRMLLYSSFAFVLAVNISDFFVHVKFA